MMILERIKATYLAARKAREADKTALLSTLVGELETLSKAGKGELTDDMVISLIKKFIKNNAEAGAAVVNSIPDGVAMKDAAVQYHRIGVLNVERQLLESFLPKQLTEDELTIAIGTAVAGGAKNVGDAMKFLKANYAGLYDGAVASRLLKVSFA